MKFEIKSCYAHQNFLDCYIKILANLDGDNYFISWYNKNWNNGKFFIGTDTVVINPK